MNEIKWNDRFNIGVENIDKAHQRLFAIVNKLLSLNEDTDKQQHACREGIKYFKSYTIKHFAEEEAYMQSINYAGYAIHKSLHDDMRTKTLPALEEELEAQDYSVEAVQHFIGICIGWLNGHIMVEDHAITGTSTNKWVHQPSEDELAALEKAIIQTLEKLFHLHAQTISIHYNGKDFAGEKALCYRLTYTAPETKPLHIYLVYEEQMILSMISELLGKEIKRVDKTVASALKILSQKFMYCIADHFADGRRLEKTAMLSYDQIVRIFMLDKQYPAYSLLFSTDKKGYFAFFIK